jgi:UDP-N-acetylglucosamine--N-acetylmuramyl-(pentapeptide) pyrophosphoryl-undecaprenol N-acetylglucosamine transferase
MTAPERLPLVVVAAGGTGGHLFPAEALAVALRERGIRVDLITDERATRYGGTFPADETHIVPSATFRGRDPASLLRTSYVLGRGVLRAYRLFWRIAPAAVVGFGGYPTIPPVLAAALRRIPSVIHEQNGVPGRANRLLAPRATAIATGFPGVFGYDPRLAAKATHTGNPVRPAVVEAAGVPYPDAASPFRLLVFGGSQGARIMAEIVPPAVELLPVALRARLAIVQQARDEDLFSVREAYARTGVPAEVRPFFRDLPARIAASHLIISRAGASTIAELAAIGRPAILVPLPHALDQDQMANAGMLEKAGGASRIKQASFSPEFLAAEIARLTADPATLPAMAAAAKTVGIVDAADRLADLVSRMAKLAPRDPAPADPAPADPIPTSDDGSAGPAN